MAGSVTLKIGAHLLDVLDPNPALIDLTAIERSLWTARRFSNNPASLLVRQHTGLVAALATLMGEPFNVVQWCSHHDDHEGIIGDIPGPLKHHLNYVMRLSMSDSLDEIEYGLDRAICEARGIPVPSMEIRKRVHHYDKLAETIEWRFVMGEPEAMWNKPVHNWLSETVARDMADRAAAATPPSGLF